jgi:hypothetical protein
MFVNCIEKLVETINKGITMCTPITAQAINR